MAQLINNPTGIPIGQLFATQVANDQLPVSTTDTAALFNQGASPAVITDFRLQHHFQWDRHTYMMGIASPGGFGNQAAAFVQLAAPTLLWIADWTSCRFLNQAVIPDPTIVDSNWILLDAWLEPYSVVIAHEGTTPLYRYSGVYIYGNKNPSPAIVAAIQNQTFYPLSPWVDGSSLQLTIDPTQLQAYLLEPQSLANH